MDFYFDELNYVGFATVNCIVTGEPATLWTGHVIAKSLGRVMGDARSEYVHLGIIAGFKDEATYKAATSDGRGCFGVWYPKYGVRDSHANPA